MKQLAEKVGVAEGTISRWESGKIKDMRRDKIKALAKALDISLYAIMDWKEPHPVSLSQPESEVIEKYHKLNDKGKDYIDKQFDFALSQEEYKPTQPETEETDEKDAATSPILKDTGTGGGPV